MKKIFILLLTFLNVAISYTTCVNIPDAKSLYGSFKGTTFIRFVEQTDLIDQLAGKRLDIWEVFNIVSNAIQQYKKSLATSLIPEGLKLFNKEILKIILRDSPEGLKEINDTLEEMQSKASD